MQVEMMRVWEGMMGGRIGYQICDEPRFAALRAHDPDGLLILNFTFQAEESDAFLFKYNNGAGFALGP
jgi:hypothetical protein